MNNDETAKEALHRLGYEARRVYLGDKFRGMEVLKDGVRIHKTPLFSADAMWELIGQEDFCDNNCTWRDHHPDCTLLEPANQIDT